MPLKMFRTPFRPKEYHRPKTIKEATKILAKKAKVLAGATDIFVDKDPKIEALVDIEGLGLDYICQDGEILKIGAMTTLQGIATSPSLMGANKLLQDAAKNMANRQIRNVATIGGNICHAAPSADLAPPLLALDAKAVIAGTSGERKVSIRKFILGVNKVDLKKGELLKEIQIESKPGKQHVAFEKAMRTAGDIAQVNVAVRFALKNKKVEEARIAIGAVAPTPIRATKAEKLLINKIPDSALIAEAAKTAVKETKPITDVRASAEYRRILVNVLTERALKKTLRR